MRALYPMIALALSSAAHAQLINGSFEDSNGSSLTGWEWTCGDPGPDLDAPAGGGSWCVSKEAGNTQGCFPSYIYQRLPDASNGELLTLSGWVRCTPSDIPGVCLGAYIGFGSLNSGVFQIEENVGTQDTTWTFVTITDTVQVNTGDTAIAVLYAGMIGGPINPFPGRFDALVLEVAQGLHDAAAPLISLYPDPATDVLYIGCAQGPITSIVVFNSAGQAVRSLRGGGNTAHVDVSALPPGAYSVRVRTANGEGASPFIKR